MDEEEDMEAYWALPCYLVWDGRYPNGRAQVIEVFHAQDDNEAWTEFQRLYAERDYVLTAEQEPGAEPRQLGRGKVREGSK